MIGPPIQLASSKKKRGKQFSFPDSQNSRLDARDNTRQIDGVQADPKQQPNYHYLLDDLASGQINTNDHMTFTQLLPRTQVMPSVDILPK